MMNRYYSWFSKIGFKRIDLDRLLNRLDPRPKATFEPPGYL